MRNIFLILLLANLLLLGWVLWVDPEPSAALPATDASELPIYGQSNSRASTGPDTADAASQCVYIGPVPDASAAQQLSATLAKRGIKVRVVPREARVWLGHWVQVQGFADKEQAEIARQRLLRAELPDAYVMQDGPVTVISLGVFRELGGAEGVIEAARRAGIQAVMRERYKTAAEYWLVSDPGGDQQALLRNLAIGYDRILRAESLPCPASTDLMPRPVAPP